MKRPSTAGMKMLSADRRCSSCTSTIRVDENPDSTSLPARWRSRSSHVVFPPPKRASRHFHGLFLFRPPPSHRPSAEVYACSACDYQPHSISFLSAKEIGRAGQPRLEADKKGAVKHSAFFLSGSTAIKRSAPIKREAEALHRVPPYTGEASHGFPPELRASGNAVRPDRAERKRSSRRTAGAIHHRNES